LLKDSEVFDGGTSRVTSCREYRKTGCFEVVYTTS